MRKSRYRKSSRLLRDMIECFFFFFWGEITVIVPTFFYYTLLRRLFDVTVGKVVD